MTPNKAETFAGKWTARVTVTKAFNQPDGSIVKVTRRIDKDGIITDKVEHRHKRTFKFVLNSLQHGKETMLNKVTG